MEKQLDEFDRILAECTAYLRQRPNPENGLSADPQNAVATLKTLIGRLAAVHQHCSQHYRVLWDRANDALFLAEAETGRVVNANRKAEELLGMPLDKLLGLTAADIAPPGSEAGARRMFEHFATRDSATTTGMNVSIRNLTTGELISVEISGSRVEFDQRAYVLGIFRDMRAHTQLEAALAASEHRYKRLFHESVVPNYTTNEHGRILEVNRAFLELFDYTREELQELRASDLYVDPKEREIFVEKIRETGYVKDHQVRLRRKDGHILTCLLSTSLRENGHKTHEYQGSINDITAQVEAQKILRYRAEHDHVTDLFKIHLFEERLEAAIDDAQTTGNRYSVLFLNPQGLKHVNDTTGIEGGNRFLKAMGRTVVETLEGLRSRSFVARLNNDTIGVLLEGSSISQGREVGETLLKRLNKQCLPTYAPFGIPTSIGVAEIAGSADETRETIFKRGDDACKIASKRGGNQVVPYTLSDPQIAWAHDKPTIADEGLLALEEGRLYLVRQGIYAQQDAQSRLILEELLLRMEPRPGERTIQTADLILALEEQGKIKPVEEWVLRQAFQAVARGGGPYTVNLSAHALNTPERLEHIIALNREFPIDPSRILFEITETVVKGHLQTAEYVAHELAKIGHPIIIDDFGSRHGNHNITELKGFPISYVKLDGGLVENLGVHPDAGDEVIGFTSLGKCLGTPDAKAVIIAEHVETQSAQKELKAYGIVHHQGHLYGKPPFPRLDEK